MKHLKAMNTNELIALFVQTGSINDKHISTVRGWIMAELEARNPEAFDAWLDSDEPNDEDLYSFYL